MLSGGPDGLKETSESFGESDSLFRISEEKFYLLAWNGVLLWVLLRNLTCFFLIGYMAYC